MFNTRFVPLRTAALCACLLSSALLTGCGGGSSTPTTSVLPTTNADGSLTSAPRSYNHLQFTLTTNKAVYATGEAVQFTLTITNTGTQAITITVYGATTGRQVLQGNTMIFPGPGEGQGAVIHTITYAPGETKTYTDTWAQKNMQNAQVAPGQYCIVNWYKARQIIDPSLSGDQMQQQFSDAQQTTALAAYPVQVTVQ